MDISQRHFSKLQIRRTNKILSHCIKSPFHYCEKILKINLQEESLIVAYSFRGFSPHFGPCSEAVQHGREHMPEEIAHNMVSKETRKQRKKGRGQGPNTPLQ
jgi:hypothetical protein